MATMESKYVAVRRAGGEEGKAITDAQGKFEAWMQAKKLHNLPLAWPVKCTPYDGRKGGCQGMAYATDLVIEYLEGQPGQGVFYNELQDHALVIGEVSDLWAGDGPLARTIGLNVG